MTWLWIVLAAVVGIVAGWLLHAMLHRSARRALEEQLVTARTKRAVAEKERTALLAAAKAAATPAPAAAPVVLPETLKPTLTGKATIVKAAPPAKAAAPAPCTRRSTVPSRPPDPQQHFEGPGAIPASRRPRRRASPPPRAFARRGPMLAA
ncbi:MAG: hypothetical protein J7480_05870 [Microbacteriaceae bacterium]|nr:hypothetical protein [Microbacteriaceae bacterium]